MTAPETGPADPAKVIARLRLSDETDVTEATEATEAVNAAVRSWPCGTSSLKGDEVEAWPADTVLGATMLAARVFRRRNSPLGVEAIGDGPVYVRRNDPDVAMLLRLGDNLTPRVG